MKNITKLMMVAILIISAIVLYISRENLNKQNDVVIQTCDASHLCQHNQTCFQTSGGGVCGNM